uniref:Integrase zinc-binding domain-containing protein n=1 Tax=Vitis vinifera TaxID=29760 RepID=A5BEC9_VITVI|nr:hypothetical protein VITISV_022551 [Vitis vinifera]
MGLDPHNAPFNTYSCVWAEVDGLKMSLGVPQCGSYSAHHFSISAQGGVVSTSATHKGKKGVRSREGVGRTDAEKSIELLTEWEFRERFRVPYGVAICLMVGGPMSTENEPFDSTVFSNEQFNVGLCFSLPSLFKQFLHFTKILLAFLHPNTIRTHSGSRDPGGLIDMQYPPPLFERAYRLLKFLRGFSYEIQEEYEAKDGCMAQYLSKGVCGNHTRGRILAHRAHSQEYYWPTMKQDVEDYIKRCDQCQRHTPIPRMPSEVLNPVMSPWSFAQWGMDIVGPLPIVAAHKKFMLITTDFFSKWVEA